MWIGTLGMIKALPWVREARLSCSDEFHSQADKILEREVKLEYGLRSLMKMRAKLDLYGNTVSSSYFKQTNY